MGPDTKAKAIEKLNKMNVKIGYPDKWIDYGKLEIGRDSYIDNVIAANIFDFNREFAKIGKKVDRSEWHMTPQTINAYYSPTMNEIVFPAGILQPPFFNLYADDPVNYGAIGAVIGHEMTHGFDDQGREYNVFGNMENWWSKKDAENFKKKTKMIVEHYSRYMELDSVPINGEMTLGENIADLGGVTIALTALKKAMGDKLGEGKIDGFTPLQRYFLSYAQVWRQNIRDKALLQRIKTDVHSPGDARVNMIVSFIPDFYTAFDIKEGDKMYKTVEERAKIW
jgi:predicted metalloendopeptidase